MEIHQGHLLLSNLHPVVDESEKNPIWIADEKLLDYLNACEWLRT